MIQPFLCLAQRFIHAIGRQRCDEKKKKRNTIAHTMNYCDLRILLSFGTLKSVLSACKYTSWVVRERVNQIFICVYRY